MLSKVTCPVRICRWTAAVALLVGFALPLNAMPVLYGAAKSGQSGTESTLYTIDPLSGAATPVGPIGFPSVGGIDFAADGTLFGVSHSSDEFSSNLITIAPGTGAGTLVGPLGDLHDGRFDVSFRNGDGVLHATGFVPDPGCVAVGTINTGTGASTPLGPSTTCAPGNALGFSQADQLFQADIGIPPFGSVYQINQADGAATPIAGLSFVGFPILLEEPRINAMDFHPLTDVAYVSVNEGSGGSGPNYLGTLDPFSGIITHIGQTVNGLDALAWGNPSGVPEPATTLLLAVGLACLAVARRQRA